jgi:hypothetical protein
VRRGRRAYCGVPHVDLDAVLTIASVFPVSPVIKEARALHQRFSKNATHEQHRALALLWQYLKKVELPRTWLVLVSVYEYDQEMERLRRI